MKKQVGGTNNLKFHLIGKMLNITCNSKGLFCFPIYTNDEGITSQKINPKAAQVYCIINTLYQQLLMNL